MAFETRQGRQLERGENTSDLDDALEAPSPIVVDLDGTLVSTDTLVESVLKVVKKSPLDLLRLPIWLLKGRAAFKTEIADRANLAVDRLPYRDSLIAYLRAEKGKGRRIILATAAHEDIARGVCAHLDLFDGFLATTADRNLKGRAKLAAIQNAVGTDFVYAGDAAADLPIWKASRGAILVGVSPRIARAVRRDTPVEKEFGNEAVGPRVWLKAMRVHQWVKNRLLFVPLLTSFSFTDTGMLLRMAEAFLSFSIAASATYMVNDLWDLDSDRVHPRKRLRPFACGRIPILRGLVVAACALIAAVIGAWAVSPGFLLMLLGYLVLTTAYSMILKAHVLIDVLILALLYTFRIMAGAVVAGVATSSWLLAFSFFIFLSLALVKRCSELLALERLEKQATRGRDYQVSDLVVLWPLGVGSALAAVVVFGLFISVPETQARYATPHLLWLVAVALVYWLGRFWIKTSRGEMHDDPIIFALKDRSGRFTVLAMVIVTLVAHYLTLGALP